MAAQNGNLAWVGAEGGYQLALEAGKLVAKNAKGKRLKTVPAKLKKGETAGQLASVRDWLKVHERECAESVDLWMLRSLPVPLGALTAVWDDPAWQGPLKHAVVLAVGAADDWDQDEGGFLQAVDNDKGIGVVTLDGETLWLDTKRIAIPHPILLEDLDDYRELATELDFAQQVSQLFRETWTRSEAVSVDSTSIADYADGKFEQLNHALGRCRRYGYRVSGGFATQSVWEDGGVVEARYWIGAENPEYETYTGELLWVDSRERRIKLVAVGPVAFSEGMRMASTIFAGRVVDKETNES